MFFLKLVTKTKIRGISFVTWTQNWELLIFCPWHQTLWWCQKLKCRKEHKIWERAHTQKKASGTLATFKINNYSIKGTFDCKSLTANPILFTCSEHSQRYFQFKSEQASPFNRLVHFSRFWTRTRSSYLWLFPPSFPPCSVGRIARRQKNISGTGLPALQ